MQRYVSGPVLLFCLLLLSACCGLPSRQNISTSYHIADTAQTALGQLSSQLFNQTISQNSVPATDQAKKTPEKQPSQTARQLPAQTASSFSTQVSAQPDQPNQPLPARQTGYQLLYDPIDAISARLLLINSAQRSLDLQYYIWQNDNVGALMCRALLQAADRGVKVRLLLDDNNTKGLDALLLALAQHPNIEVRLFNPFVHRNIRTIDYVFDFKRSNHRMHNKLFVADGQFAIIGGRNISNEYFDAGDSFQFSDIDVLLTGQILPEISQSFDDYWNYQAAYPVQSMVKPRQHPLSLQSLRQQLDTHVQQDKVKQYLAQARAEQPFETWLQGEPPFLWVNSQLVQDAPQKIDKDADPTQHLAFQLQHALGQPQQQVDLVSAYFVIDDKARNKLAALSQQGVKIRILTNSYAANDVKIVHAFYAKNREFLLKNGIQLYEFLPVIKNYNLWHRRSKRKLIDIKGTSDASLHAKMLSMDNQQVFIGSFNFDLRSANINTEVGVILDSPSLAQQVSEEIDRNILKVSYRLRLDDKGRLQWEEGTPAGTVTHPKEPNLGPVSKMGLKMISLLPLDGLM